MEIQILDDKVEILNFPGPMPPVDKKMLQEKKRIITREYRNRKLGDYFKELKLTEGRGTGLPIIYDSMEKNGSPMPMFETDEDRNYFLCTLPIHPLSMDVFVSRKGLRRDIDKGQNINSLNELNDYLRSGSELSWDQVETKLRMELEARHLKIVSLCQLPKSRTEILEYIGLFNNTRNFSNYVKPLIDLQWIAQTHPDKPTSKIQQYYTTELGKNLLKAVTLANKPGIEKIPLASSNIASVGYDRERMIMEIEFHKGAVYQYFDVPENIYLRLVNAPSHGAYFMHEVKEKFKYQKTK